jgi:hypothetical protein
MTAIAMQVACGCGSSPVGMDNISCYDGDFVNEGFILGRRYIWQCPLCGNQVCVNLRELDDEV